jgi:diadenylate cyclase
LIALITIGFLEIKFVDIIDILLVTFMIVQVYKLMKGSIAIKVFIGFLFLYLIYLLVRAAKMDLITTILGQFMGVGVLASIILFQQEIRKFLLLLGRSTVFKDANIFRQAFAFWTSNGIGKTEVPPIIDAIRLLGQNNTGALFVISRNSPLKFYADSGDRMNSLISKRLILAIFNKHSPMHDGAMIIYDNKIIAARCVLPVTERDDVPANFGMRHRAAVGMSETTDSLVLVVSEETGEISTARNGLLSENLSIKELRAALSSYFSEVTTPVKDESDEAEILA